MSSYERYRDVQSFWVSQVPEHWTTQKNKYVFTQKKEIVGDQWENYTLLTMGKTGVKPRDMDGGGKFPESFENYQVVNPDQLIFCLFDLDETPRTIGKSNEHGMITSAYDVFYTQSNHDSQYWTYFYQTIDDHKGLRPYYTGLRKVVRFDTFMGIEVYSPPLQEQQLISCYLDKKTEQIDSLIKKIQKKIELLKEQRTSLINQCVTKGLDPYVEMKDSGVEWIGEIPSHWNLSKIKYLSSVISKGTTPSTIGEETVNDGEVRYLKSENIVDGQVVKTPEFFISSETDELIKRSRLQHNDILVVIAGAMVGKTAVLDQKLLPANTNQAVSFIRLVDNSLSSLVYRWMSSEYVRLSVKTSSVVSAQPNLSMESLGNFLIPVPPKEEWIKISKVLDSQLEQLDCIATTELKRITLLKEYRQSLISSVVTGKVRVTEDMI